MLLRYRSTTLPWLSARWIFRNRMHHQGPYIVPAAAALSMLPPPGPGFRPHIQGAVRYRKTFLLRPTVWLVRIVQASGTAVDRKSTRLNSSHVAISYAVLCLKI